MVREAAAGSAAATEVASEEVAGAGAVASVAASEAEEVCINLMIPYRFRPGSS